MNPAVFGVLTALGWGSADFIARFTGRALGHEASLFGMLSVSAVVLSVILWWVEVPIVLHLGGLWLLGLTGIGVMVATLLLYLGLARGPVTIVAPIVGSYPAVNVALAVVLGSRPSPAQWIAIAVVMAGVAVVARAARSFEDDGDYSAAALRKTIVISLASALVFAATVAAGQAAAPIYGELPTTVMARWISWLAIVVLYLAVHRTTPRIPGPWWPVLAVQGLLDGGAYVALFASGLHTKAEIAAVVASAFSAVTVILARVVLREAMTGPQWLGIALIVGGAASLSWPDPL